MYAFEPSPKNYERSRATLAAGIKSGRVHLEQKAAGNRTGDQVEFHASGSVFDHPGPLISGDDAAFKSQQAAVQVETLTLDDYFFAEGREHIGIYIAKIDTQGFDGAVLQGMRRLLAARRVHYILFELWPKAMVHAVPCEDALRFLLPTGYTLFEMPVAYYWDERHQVPGKDKAFNHPSDPAGLCKWYTDNSQQFGLWTDILAVSASQWGVGC